MTDNTELPALPEQAGWAVEMHGECVLFVNNAEKAAGKAPGAKTRVFTEAQVRAALAAAGQQPQAIEVIARLLRVHEGRAEDESRAIASQMLGIAGQREQAPKAWMHPDGRVVPAAKKEQAEKDGGAMRSSLAGYTIPLGVLTGKRDPLSDDARDAARYRWLRDSVRHAVWPPARYPTAPWCVRTEIDHQMPANKFIGGADLDASIDAAMAEGSK